MLQGERLLLQSIKRQVISCLKPYDDIPPLAWWLMLGTGISNLLNFACMPFLAIILAKQGTNPVHIGVVLGAAPLVGLIAGFMCSSLSDYVGRRVIILFSLYLWAISFFLFFITSHTTVYMFVSALLGLSQSLFEPTSQALLSDLVPKDKIKILFKLRYLILNIGFAFGPLLGAILSVFSEKSGFLLASIFFGMYASIIAAKSRPLGFIINYTKKRQKFLRQTFSILITDKALLRFLVGGICIAITYSQFESTFPQYMYAHGLGNFSYAALLMINAFGVLIFQIPISKIADKFEVLSGMRNGGILVALGYLFIAISGANLATMFLGMLVITFGELLISPVQNVVVNRLATPDTYGLYFGAYNLRQFGFSLGPLIGGYFLGFAGSAVCFLIVAMFAIIASYFFGSIQNTLEPEKNFVECGN